MVYAVYIAAAAVVGLLIGFVVLSIVWLRKTVSRNIRSKTMGLLSVYDELLDEKSRELADMEADARKKADGGADASVGPETLSALQPTAGPLRASEMLDMAERSGGTVYRDGAVGGVYCKIRGNFSFRLEELLPAFRGESEPSGGPASRLLAALDYDTVFRLSTMPEEDQIAILREVLPQEWIALLDAYLETHLEFHVLEFYDSLRSLADTEPQPARLRVPAGVVMDRVVHDGVEIIPDDGICEGFQLEEDNLLYDYCIKARELS